MTFLQDLKSKEKLSCLFLIIAVVQFIILTNIAILFYPGNYSSTRHTFSYLGQITVNGADNIISRIIFIIACTIVAIALIPFWLTMPILFKENITTKNLSKFGTICGVLSAPFLSLISIVPLDWGYEVHMIPTDIFFIGITSAIMIYSIAIFFNHKYNNIYAIVGLVLSIIAFLYIFRFFDVIRPIMQRFVVYSFIFWAFIQIAKVWKFTGTQD